MSLQIMINWLCFPVKCAKDLCLDVYNTQHMQMNNYFIE